jgi:hypothetical protein
VVSFICLFKIHSKLQYVLNDGKTPVSVYCTQIHNLKYFSREKFLLYHYHLTEIVFYYTNTYWQLCIRWWPLVGPVFLNNNFNFNNINIKKITQIFLLKKWQKNSLKFLNLKKKKKNTHWVGLQARSKQWPLYNVLGTWERFCHIVRNCVYYLFHVPVTYMHFESIVDPENLRVKGLISPSLSIRSNHYLTYLALHCP